MSVAKINYDGDSFRISFKELTCDLVASQERTKALSLPLRNKLKCVVKQINKAPALYAVEIELNEAESKQLKQLSRSKRIGTYEDINAVKYQKTVQKRDALYKKMSNDIDWSQVPF